MKGWQGGCTETVLAFLEWFFSSELVVDDEKVYF